MRSAMAILFVFFHCGVAPAQNHLPPQATARDERLKPLEATSASILAAARSAIREGRALAGCGSAASTTKPASARASAARSESRQKAKLLITVVDENGIAVPSAQVSLELPDRHASVKGETDYAGRREVVNLTPGVYHLVVEKEGFYAVILNDVQVGETGRLEITLHHQQEFTESMEVVYSPPAIDPTKLAKSEDLSSQEIINLPYPTTRDIRNALPLLPGVLQDATGQVHVNGSGTEQIFDQLDGFNITQPVTGLLTLRVSTDAVREIEVQGSRSSAQYGKGSGGTVSLVTGMGDDRYRFSATNFIPSLQTQKGLTINDWTPRATFSGPLRQGKAWFFDAADGETKLKIFNELPPGADRNRSWRVSNLAKAQVNVTQTHILSASFLFNQFHADHAGLSPLNPLETTVNQNQSAYLVTLKDQAYFSNGLLLELGLGVNEYRTDDRPRGSAPYVIRPEGTSGNFFKTDSGRARRVHWISTLFLPPVQWHGRHEFKLGTDVDRITYHQFDQRRPIFIRREDGTLSRQITFVGDARFGKNNVETSGFAQDRWSVSDQWLLELGLRFDWDEIVRSALISPRLSSSYLLTQDGHTKITAGIGLVYDATHLDLIARPVAGRRSDLFFASDGQTPVGPPVETSFQVNEHDLRAPRFLNWSVGMERRLPASIYWRAEFMQKRGRHGLTFINRGGGSPTPVSGFFELRSDRQDRYDAVQISARRVFNGDSIMFASYTRSAARSNAVLDFNIDNPLFSRQAGGPLPWDAPNRFLSWGWLPLVKRFNLGYSLEWRDGYPFSLVNQDQHLVGSPNARRFPAYFTLNAHVERRFRWLGFQWALRAGFDDLTNRQNPSDVNNNVDSPRFLTFSGKQHRVFTGRIRFLGRK
jgi:hypothetical protein